MHEIKQLNLPQQYRLIAISDVHGNLEELKSLLEKVNYEENDFLVVIGDLCEKGPNSLGVVRFLRGLSEENTNVNVVLGNCDDIYEAVCQKNEEVIEYLCWRKESIVNEWLNTLNYEVHKETSCEEIIELLENSSYKEDIAFLNSLPIAIETDDFIFVHAGIEDSENWHDSSMDFMYSAPKFYESSHQSSKVVIVGHYPVCAYDSNQALNVNPKIDLEKRIIAIDGGNVVKSEFGQLNALIIQKNENGIDYETTYVKKDKFVRAKKNFQAEPHIIENVVWPHYEVMIISESQYFSKCKTFSGNTIEIKNEIIDKSNRVCLRDTTSYRYSYTKGDEFEVLSNKYEGYYLVKREGIVGWVNKEDFE